MTNIKLIPAKEERKTGFAFIEFQDESNARNAMLYVNGKVFRIPANMAKVVPGSHPPVNFNLAYANSTGSAHTEYNLFVSNLPPEVDDAELFTIFGEKWLNL